MDACGDDAPLRVFPVDPADVPLGAVRAVRRTLLRQSSTHDDPADDELARVLVAVVIAALSQPAD